MITISDDYDPPYTPVSATEPSAAAASNHCETAPKVMIDLTSEEKISTAAPSAAAAASNHCQLAPGVRHGSHSSSLFLNAATH